MTYNTVATFSQVLSLLMFIAMFVGVIIFAFRPANRARFETIQRRALDLADDDAAPARQQNRGTP